jgi:nucleoside-diphosphate-sugar epimerase
MKLLITSAASDLAQTLAAVLSSEHQIRLTDLIDVETDFEFVRSNLGHGEETNRLVRGIDAIIHLAELPPVLLSKSTDAANLEIDFLTRCTYNMVSAAAAEKVTRVIYASTLRVMDRYDEDWTVTESWRPLPATDASILSKYLGEFVCREFAREGLINITCLRLGALVTDAEVSNQPFDATWLEMKDAVHIFECALKAPAARWEIFHVQSELPNSRFSILKAKDSLKFSPQFSIER